MNDFTFINDKLNLLESENLIREIKNIITASGPWVELENKKRVLQFASNNYLGIANHPDVINFCKNSIEKFGIGSSGSRLLSGTNKLHIDLEKKLAKFQNTEDVVLYGSGYAANVGVISTLISEKDAVYSDELNHASIIDGIRLSRAKKFIYNHNDLDELNNLLLENRNSHQRNFIITDTVFSMDGNLADLNKLAEIAKNHNAYTIIDEAHAIGIFGSHGEGLAIVEDVNDSFPIKIGTCSKALGVEGGFCAAPKNICDYLRNQSRTYMFSTSPTLANIASIYKALDLLMDGNWRRERLWNNAKKLYEGLKKNYKLKLTKFECPIITIYFSNVNDALNVSKRLFEECHVWAPAIRPPTVKEPRIRLTPIATHSEDDINYVIKAFDYISKDLKIEPLLFTS